MQSLIMEPISSPSWGFSTAPSAVQMLTWCSGTHLSLFQTRPCLSKLMLGQNGKPGISLCLIDCVIFCDPYTGGVHAPTHIKKCQE